MFNASNFHLQKSNTESGKLDSNAVARTELGSTSSSAAAVAAGELESEQQPADGEPVIEDSSGDTPTFSGSLQSRRRKQKPPPPTPSTSSLPVGVSDAIRELTSLSESNRRETDEFDLFCESLAVGLRKMPRRKALMCQEKLQILMTHDA